MKKITLLLLLLPFFANPLSAQTDGDLNVSTFTSEAGGSYAPRNVVAIWIENENGDFVKTLLAFAQSRKTHLNTWQASTAAAGTEFNTADAITGPTVNNHATRECMWNATDYNGNIVADGNYFVRMELTDKNGTGNFNSFAFTKGEMEELQTPAEVPSFGSINIHWIPSGVGITEQQALDTYQISNNPGNGQYEILGPSFDALEIRAINGKLLYQGHANSINICDYDNGIYLLIIQKEDQRYTKKLIKN